MGAFKFKTDLSTFATPQISKPTTNDKTLAHSESPTVLPFEDAIVKFKRPTPNSIGFTSLLKTFSVSSGKPNDSIFDFPVTRYSLIGKLDTKFIASTGKPNDSIFDFPVTKYTGAGVLTGLFNKTTGKPNDSIFDFPVTKYNSVGKLNGIFDIKTGKMGDSIMDFPASKYNTFGELKSIYNKNIGDPTDSIFDKALYYNTKGKLYDKFTQTTGKSKIDSIIDYPIQSYAVEAIKTNLVDNTLQNYYLKSIEQVNQNSKSLVLGKIVESIDKKSILPYVKEKYGALARFDYSDTQKYYPDHVNKGFDPTLKKSIFWQLLGDPKTLDTLYNSAGKLIQLVNPTTGKIINVNAPKNISDMSGYSFPPRRDENKFLKFAEPYIIREIGQQWGTGFQPGIDFVRGGIATRTNRAITDTARLGKFMLSTKGLLWNLQQAGLQLTNPNVEKLGLIAPTKIFNPIKLMMNIPGSILGLHEARHGGLSEGRYEDVISQKSIVSGVFGSIATRLGVGGATERLASVSLSTNRLVKLYSEINTGNSTATFGPKFLQKIFDKSSPIKTISGITGPGSVFGIGWTLMRKHSSGISIQDNLETLNTLAEKDYTSLFETPEKYYTVSFFNSDSKLEKLFKNPLFVPGTGDVIIGPSLTPSYKPVNQKNQGKLYLDYDALQTDREQYKSDKTQDINGKIIGGSLVSKYNPNTRNNVHIANPGAGLKTDAYGSGKQTTDVAETWADLYIRLGIPNTGEHKEDSIEQGAMKLKEDLVKLIFWRSPYGDIDSRNRIQFRAYITSISEDFSGNWSPFKYVGRPDNVYRYSDFKRSISLSFVVAIEQMESYKIIYQKLNQLASLTAPDFGTDGIMDNALCKMRVGGRGSSDGFIPPTVGMMNSVKFDIPNDYPWDISVEKPMYVNVSISFTPIAKPDLTDYPNRSGFALWDAELKGRRSETQGVDRVEQKKPATATPVQNTTTKPQPVEFKPQYLPTPAQVASRSY